MSLGLVLLVEALVVLGIVSLLCRVRDVATGDVIRAVRLLWPVDPGQRSVQGTDSRWS